MAGSSAEQKSYAVRYANIIVINGELGSPHPCFRAFRTG
jgi:hypothetical protein